MRLSPVAPTAVEVIRAFCFSTDLTGDCVYIMGDLVGGIHQVSKADIDSADIIERIAVGVIILKTSPTDCVVRLSGVMKDVYSGLQPGKFLFVGTDSRLTDTQPAIPTTGIRSSQILGYALASNEVVITPLLPIMMTP